MLKHIIYFLFALVLMMLAYVIQGRDPTTAELWWGVVGGWVAIIGCKTGVF
jgi:hypothetical protein